MVRCEARDERAGFLATHTLEAVRLDLGSVNVLPNPFRAPRL